MPSFELRATRHDLERVAAGHPVRLENDIILRLYTAAELQAEVARAQDAIGMPADDRLALTNEQLPLIELTTACRTKRHTICGGYNCPCSCHLSASAGA